MHQRADALTIAKAKSKAKTAACVARGGVYDPTAPNGCRVQQTPKTKLEQRAKQAKTDGQQQAFDAGLPQPTPWWVWALLASAAAGTGFVAWRTFV